MSRRTSDKNHRTTPAVPPQAHLPGRPVPPQAHLPGRPVPAQAHLPGRPVPAKSRPALREGVLAIVGRPNVGKSTLFNRLIGSRRAIVGDEPGITRDRIYGEVAWRGRTARVIDTGGIIPDDEAEIPAEIFRQARTALDEADVLIMVVDGRSELAAPDLDLARLLIKTGKPLFLAVNKIDTAAMDAAAENFRRLGVHNLIPVSAEHGHNIGDLLDEVFAALPTQPTRDASGATTESGINTKAESSEEAPQALPSGRLVPPQALPPGRLVPSAASPPHRTHGESLETETKVAIIGRPNVGKSTLLNALTGSSRAIVSPIAGTTRDAVDELLTYKGHELRLVDTAGIRRKGKTHLMAEKLSVVMARRHLEAADIALLVIDATEGVTASDATIGGYAHESGRSVVIVVNKWDLVTTARTDGKPPADRGIFERQLRAVLKYLSYAPVLFISATEGRNVPRVLDTVLRVAAERRKRVTTGQINRFLAQVDFQRASVPMAKRIRIYYMTQGAVAPPTFVLFTDRNVKLHFSFERFLENQIRAAFGFEGTPIWFKVRARSEAPRPSRTAASARK
jgi:GTPase